MVDSYENLEGKIWLDGELVEWSPFPLFPPYGKLVGKMSKQKNLTIYETRVQDSQIQVYF